MTEMTRLTAVHLVGSIGLDTVEDVFRTVGETRARLEELVRNFLTIHANICSGHLNQAS
jgi:hypothetical protein